MLVCAHVCMPMCVCAHVHVCIHVCVHVCICLHVCTCVHVFACVWAHIYKHAPCTGSVLMSGISPLTLIFLVLYFYYIP